MTTNSADPDPEAVADPHVLEQPLGGQVLAEDGPGQIHSGKLLAPILVVLGRVDVDGLVDAAVHRQVGLLVALEVERGHAQSAVDRCLEDGGEHRMAVPLDLSREPDAQRHDFHVNLPA